MKIDLIGLGWWSTTTCQHPIHLDFYTIHFSLPNYSLLCDFKDLSSYFHSDSVQKTQSHTWRTHLLSPMGSTLDCHPKDLSSSLRTHPPLNRSFTNLMDEPDYF